MPIPAHMIVCEGDLHDTRLPGWAANPLRKGFEAHANTIETVAQLKACLRAGAFAWPGGYPLYFIAHDGESLSFEAVRANLATIMDSIAHDHKDGWRVVGLEVNYEDSEMVCAHTGKLIPSAYGDAADEGE